MGMFDTILIEHLCHCGAKLQDYQTKALDNALNVYKLGDSVSTPNLHIEVGSFEIHDYCSACNTSIRGRAYVKDGLLAKIAEFDKDSREKLIAEYMPTKK